MRTGRASFWAGVALGVTTVAAAVGIRWWWEWHGWMAENQAPPTSLEDLDLDDTWDTDETPPGPDLTWRCWSCGARQTQGQPESHLFGCRAEPVEWVADGPEERDLHGEPEFAPEPEVWCPGVDPDPHQVYPWRDPIWEPCTATIRHNAHRRWDRRASRDPHPFAWLTGERDDGAQCAHGAEIPCPIGLSLGEHTHGPDGCANGGQPHTGPCLTVVHHTPWLTGLSYIDPPVLDQEAMAKFREGVAEAVKPLANFGEEVRKAMRPAADVFAAMSPGTPGKLAQCDREHPHPVHIHSGGICRGTPTAGEVRDA